MGTRRSDGGRAGGGAAEVVDEFACSGMLRNSLTLLHSTVERIFCVIFDIGDDDFSRANTGQIWLKLRGQDNSVQAAKLFLKGVVNQEQQQELSYPGVLHCVFCGARGLFMDSLIRRTSANIVVGSVGSLLISGLAEPVVQAYSLITDLVERCNDTHSRRTDVGEKCLGESLESRRAFKALVEKWEDRHILDLLLLPGSVKEILSDLAKESGFDSTLRLPVAAGNEEPRSTGDSEDTWNIGTQQWVDGTAAGSLKNSARTGLDCFQSFCPSSGSRGRAEGAEERLIHSPFVVEGEKILEQVSASNTNATEPREDEALQFLLLLKFFTAMGYTEDVVKRVLAQTGPKEASQILDLVQQEQDRSDRELTGQTAQIAVISGPCESEHREDEDVVTGGDNVRGEAKEVSEKEKGATGTIRCFEAERKAQRQEIEQEEDFVFGVLKKAAASCGYPEQRVAKVYNRLPERSTHQLLLELQRDEEPKIDNFRDGPRETDDVVVESEDENFEQVQDKTRGDTELLVPAVRRESPDKGWIAVPKLSKPAAEPDLLNWTNEPQQFTSNQYSSRTKFPQSSHHQVPKVQGPPMLTYNSTLDTPQVHFLHQVKKDPSVNHPNQDFFHAAPKFSSSPRRDLGTPSPHLQRGKDSSPSRAKERAAMAAPSAVVVTGEQRFMEGLQKPFKLQLTDKPGDPDLRMIIIDGSNVAMSHGLGHFFSCRGIALAVQHFWDRGHRQISTLLPQWRQKNNPKTKELHYLVELQNVGLVSFTPSREVQGKRICSYDDRFMLQLAQKTDGVIVTNDNLRDLSDESPVFRDIVKKRLLQYTFAGDLFMLPDDPLGRGGPHLHHFLRSDHRTPEPGHHSFAGVAATSSPPLKPPRSQTEVLNYRDRTVGGAQDASRRGSQTKDWEREKEWSQHGRFGSVDRSPEETASLREQLCHVFTGQDNTVALVLQCHPAETDIHVLSDLILERQTD